MPRPIMIRRLERIPGRRAVDPGRTRAARARETRAEEAEELLVFELFGQASQPASDLGIGGLDLLDPREQLIQIRTDDGFAHQIDELRRHAGQGIGCEFRVFRVH